MIFSRGRRQRKYTPYADYQRQDTPITQQKYNTQSSDNIRHGLASEDGKVPVSTSVIAQQLRTARRTYSRYVESERSRKFKRRNDAETTSLKKIPWFRTHVDPRLTPPSVY